MESNDSNTKDCSTIYRFQFASIAFLCSVYLPFTFHSNIWSLYTQSFTSVNCSMNKNPVISGLTLIPECRQCYVNSNRISCVNKLLQLCSKKQAPTSCLSKVSSPAPTNIIYDTRILFPNTRRLQTNSILCVLIN
ncbi:unnamed protein product [Rotaria sp. Silwood2]|nr:unnamed protein product [Rotaria sp. Silwood2]